MCIRDRLNAIRAEAEAAGNTFAYNYEVRGKLATSLALPPDEVQRRIERGDQWVIRFRTVSYTHLDVYKRQLGILYVLLFDAYTIPELSAGNWHNFKTDAARFPIFPTLFITIACGAVSGFHATQSPLMARCLQNEQQGKPVFFGAMISESLIALVWAAAGMAFWGGPEELNTTLAEHGDNAAWAVNEITRTTLGKFGSDFYKRQTVPIRHSNLSPPDYGMGINIELDVCGINRNIHCKI